jgi:catechol 2,3-dioxygenase-like lactoylglutathione lyase family enzyme
MPIAKLAHYSIRALDLERSRHFCERVLDFKVGYRPPFDFPGLWLYKGGDEADYGVVHLIGVSPGSDDVVSAYLGDMIALRPVRVRTRRHGPDRQLK